MNLLEAVIFGLVAGLTPSPHSLYLSCVGVKARWQSSAVLLGGVCADFFIIGVAALITRSFGVMRSIEPSPVLSLLSTAFVMVMGYRLLFKRPGGKKTAPESRLSPFLSGAGVQFLNIYPYLFWICVFFPSVRGLSALAIAQGAATFLVVTYLVKWLTYRRLAQVLPEAVRRHAIRMAFGIFAVNHVIRQTEMWLN